MSRYLPIDPLHKTTLPNYYVDLSNPHKTYKSGIIDYNYQKYYEEACCNLYYFSVH